MSSKVLRRSACLNNHRSPLPIMCISNSLIPNTLSAPQLIFPFLLKDIRSTLLNNINPPIHLPRLPHPSPQLLPMPSLSHLETQSNYEHHQLVRRQLEKTGQLPGIVHAPKTISHRQREVREVSEIIEMGQYAVTIHGCDA